MIFTLLFVLWTSVLLAAWLMPRSLAVGSVILALGMTLALFIHHVTDPLTLSF